MQKYEKGFRGLPHGRPPDRGVEHNIVLEEGTSPIQIPPYIHPKKFIDDIEKAIQELLELGLIRRSSSTKIFQEAHDFPLASHMGIFKTYRKLRKILFWKGLKEDIQKYVNKCNVCQKNKSELTFPAILLQPLPILEQKMGHYLKGFHHWFAQIFG